MKAYVVLAEEIDGPWVDAVFVDDHEAAEKYAKDQESEMPWRTYRVEEKEVVNR